MENENKKKASNKEIMMIIIVVVLAFGLTVAGIVYLTNFLIGDNTPQQPQVTQQDPAVPQAPADNTTDPVIIFTDNATDNGSTVAAPTTPITPTTPVTSTPTTPAIPTTPVVTTPTTPTTPVTSPQVASIPTTSPTKGAYQLQLSAFKSEDKANAEAQKYRAEYPDIYVMRADLGADGVWFRVRCCSAGSQDELASIKAEMERKYKITPYIVKVQ